MDITVKTCKTTARGFEYGLECPKGHAFTELEPALPGTILPAMTVGEVVEGGTCPVCHG